MRKKLQEWLANLGKAYPSASSPYWRSLPLRHMKALIAGVFRIASVVGFTMDLLLLGSPPIGRGLFWPLFFGVAGAALFVARIKRRWIVPVLVLLVCAIGWFVTSWAYGGRAHFLAAVSKQRVMLDCIGIYMSAAIGYRLLLFFVSTEGLNNVRIQTELALAHGIQNTLVPAISLENARFEVYGKSIPSEEMGGDLIDVIESDGTLMAYVADVSGHGLPAGQLMGMLKTAMRVSSDLRRQPVAMVDSADRVLPAVKGRNMFATLALLYFSGSGQAEYLLAGHVPIVHYRHRTRDTMRLSMEQFPLGLFPNSGYAIACVTYSAGDLFLLVSDGVTEVVNPKDEEFGLARVEQLLMQNAAKPLAEIWTLIMAAADGHGPRQDDQSLLLLRARNAL